MNRRTVLRQAVKLVYAAPLIVATLKYEEAAAQIPVGCSCPEPAPDL